MTEGRPHLSAAPPSVAPESPPQVFAGTAASAPERGWGVTQLMGMQEDPTNVYKVGLNTTRLLLSTTDLVVGWLLLRQADVALQALDAGGSRPGDADFYAGKIGAARFFAATVLPELSARRAVLEATTLDAMELPESAF